MLDKGDSISYSITPDRNKYGHITLYPSEITPISYK